jgi:hypothetical protein
MAARFSVRMKLRYPKYRQRVAFRGNQISTSFNNSLQGGDHNSRTIHERFVVWGLSWIASTALSILRLLLLLRGVLSEGPMSTRPVPDTSGNDEQPRY